MADVTDIKIYTTKVCAYCHAEKEFLKANNVAYQEVRVDEDEQAAEAMVALSGQLAVPFTVVKKSDDSEEHILGFDQPRLSALLGL